jgi:acetoacetate decarboxylase
MLAGREELATMGFGMNSDPLKGYTLPRTPKGLSSLAPAPPWHYVGHCLAVEYEGAAEAVRGFLPAGLELASPRCAAYFVEWQFATETGEEYLDPAQSQYRETLFLVSARFEGQECAFCPFIWVDQDVALMRGLAQGWPKQIGSTWVTHAFELPSKAAPAAGPGGKFGATLCAKDRRLAQAEITLRAQTEALPKPGFARAVNTRHFPDLAGGRHEKPLVYDLVQLKSRDVRVSPVWKGEARLEIFEHPRLEVYELRPVKVLAGYRFSFALTVDDVVVLRDLRS